MAPDDTPPADESPELVAARRRGDPYLVYSDGSGRPRVLSLPESWTRVTVGRGMTADIALTWDEDVSRIHAELERLGEEWVLVDDGLSRNGSYVNGDRVERRRRLLDGDELRFGDTTVSFFAPFQVDDQTRSATQPG